MFEPLPSKAIDPLPLWQGGPISNLALVGWIRRFILKWDWRIEDRYKDRVLDYLRSKQGELLDDWAATHIKSLHLWGGLWSN